jgi:hypothetical protein
VSLVNGPTIFYQVLAQLRDDLIAEFTTANAAFARMGIVPGAIAWDECDQCGLLALAATRQFLSSDPPTEDPQPMTGYLVPYLCADLAIQAIRCVPTVNDVGTAPSVSALDASAQRINADAVIVMCTVVDTLTKLETNEDIVMWGVRQQLFMGPEGACGGSELDVWVAESR